MLSISAKDYYLPVRYSDGGVVRWALYRRKTDEVTYASQFNYTVQLSEDSSDRITFIYNGSSVKPTPRTLRLNGAERLAPVVSMLAKNEGMNIAFDYSIKKH
jgi:hypothetical protein